MFVFGLTFFSRLNFIDKNNRRLFSYPHKHPHFWHQEGQDDAKEEK